VRKQTFAFLLLSAVSTSAQPISFGVVGGLSLTQDFRNKSIILDNGDAILTYSTPKRWIAGGTVEARLRFHLSFEIDVLYHELEFTQALLEKSTGTLSSVSPAPVVTWEFPLLVKYRFSFPLGTPFVDAGPAFRSAGNLNGTAPSNHGLAAGLGVEVHVWRLKIAPQFRYTRWAHDSKTGFFALFSAPDTAPNQVEFLTSITL
jgi:hypothetical protein